MNAAFWDAASGTLLAVVVVGDVSTNRLVQIDPRSGLVEPIGGVLGAAFVHYCRPMLPYTMSLAAGAMIFVVCDSLVPEMQQHGNKGLAMQGLMLGFVIMMVLDVALG